MASWAQARARARCGSTAGPGVTPLRSSAGGGTATVETTGQRRSRLALAALMVAAGCLHFLAPDAYARIVPRRLGDARLIVHLSGVAEVAAGALLVSERTRRVGGWCTAAVLVAVFPANVQMALDGGLTGAGGALGSPVVAWLRLPLQAPLLVWALRHARRGPRARRRVAGPAVAGAHGQRRLGSK